MFVLNKQIICHVLFGYSLQPQIINTWAKLLNATCFEKQMHCFKAAFQLQALCH